MDYNISIEYQKGAYIMASLDTIGGLHYEMMRRCYNEKSVAYKDYGAKGIKVCEEWHNREVFKKWCKDNGWNKDLRLNRIDGTKDYCPENCYFGNRSSKIGDGIAKTLKQRAKNNKKKKTEAGIIGKIDDDPLHNIFASMHSRCENPNHINYKNYGGKNITVCEQWSGKDGFINFKMWSNENGWVDGLSLDRVKNDKGYCPGNCRWVTRLQQCYNKTNNILYNYGGIEMPLGMIAKLENVNYGMLYSRVRQKGMSINEAIADIKKSGS